MNGPCSMIMLVHQRVQTTPIQKQNGYHDVTFNALEKHGYPTLNQSSFQGNHEYSLVLHHTKWSFDVGCLGFFHVYHLVTSGNPTNQWVYPKKAGNFHKFHYFPKNRYLYCVGGWIGPPLLMTGRYEEMIDLLVGRYVGKQLAMHLGSWLMTWSSSGDGLMDSSPSECTTIVFLVNNLSIYSKSMSRS